MTGAAAAAASLPPLIADRCLRTVLSSSIVAPPLSSRRTVSCLSSSVMPSAGSAISAEAPPESSTTSRSRLDRSGRDRQRAPGRRRRCAHRESDAPSRAIRRPRAACRDAPVRYLIIVRSGLPIAATNALSIGPAAFPTAIDVDVGRRVSAGSARARVAQARRARGVQHRQPVPRRAESHCRSLRRC